jgi:hypothetical protein
MRANQDERPKVVTLYKQWCIRNWGALVTKMRSLSLQRADRFEGAISMFPSVPDRVVNDAPLQIVESVNS